MATWGALERGRAGRPAGWSARPRWSTRRSGSGPNGAMPGWSASTAEGRIDPDELMARRRRLHRARPRPVGQPRGRDASNRSPRSSRACRDRGVLVHVDAAMAAGHVPIDFVGLGADLMSISGHKFGGTDRHRRPAGPTGPAAPTAAGRWRPGAGPPGRSRERGRASIGFGAAREPRPALHLAGEQQRRARRSPTGCWPGRRATDGITVFGDPDPRLPHLVCLGIEGIEPQAVLLGLDQAGVAVHSGSSCSTESLEPSPVLEAMGVDAHRSLRISVGWSTTDADIDRLLEALPDVIGRLRALREPGSPPPVQPTHVGRPPWRLPSGSRPDAVEESLGSRRGVGLRSRRERCARGCPASPSAPTRG